MTTRSAAVPAAISSRTSYKRRFTLGEMYRSFVLVPGAVAEMVRNRRSRLLDRRFVERLQLSVTEVNGCPACSYAHAHLALQQGMPSEEIHAFLSGDGQFVEPAEARAIAFAQHCADSRGRPSQEAWRAIVDEYGQDRARVILAAVQLMMAGNVYGIPYSAFSSRLKGAPYRDSTLRYELGMLVAGLLLLPIALVHGLLRSRIADEDTSVADTAEQHDRLADL